jgi:hypothetical protein
VPPYRQRTTGTTRASSTLVHDSHRSLLRRRGPAGSAVSRLDGVVVPSKRVHGHLDYAASLAHEWDCPLLVLADAAGPRWNGITARNRGRTVTVAVPPLQSTPQFEFATNQHPVAISPRDLEVSAKRNVGLLLARLLGWRTILFLDDDARSLEDVRGTLASLGRARAAGWRMTHFPDNSVVCHANRLSGGFQGVFAGAGALVIQTEGCLPFFPAVYNEDWLFLYHWLARDAVLDAGEVRQIPYDPFADPERAAREEFGDILGEGLFQLLHDRRSARTASRASYWAAFQDRRHLLIDRIERRLEGIERSGNVWAARRSLAAARCRSEAIRRWRSTSIPGVGICTPGTGGWLGCRDWAPCWRHWTTSGCPSTSSTVEPHERREDGGRTRAEARLGAAQPASRRCQRKVRLHSSSPTTVQSVSTTAHKPSCQDPLISWLSNEAGRSTERMPCASHFSGNSVAMSRIQAGSWL